MKKNTKLIVAAALAMVLVVGCVIGRQAYQRQQALAQQEFDAAYLVIDGREIRRDSEALDLSGSPLTEWEKLPKLTELKELDLRSTGISADIYRALCESMPDCSIRWSVPFQGGHIDHDVTSLDLTSLSEEDLAMLAYFPALTDINAEGCTDYDALIRLTADNPQIQLSYSVVIGDTAYSSTVNTLSFTDPNAEELGVKLKYLPDLTTVTLEGDLPEQAQLIALKNELPNITFIWEFDFMGRQVNTLTETIDISRLKLKDTAELESLLPCFYDLQKVDMCSCGISDEEMGRLNRQYPDTRFIWEVNICGHLIRTDIISFMPFEYDMTDSEYSDYSNLRYCTDLVLIDMGHYTISDLSFLRYLPKLEYLMICDSQISDLSVIGECTSLRFLEIFLNPVTDFWPLLNLTNLEDLNISYTPCTQRTRPRQYGHIGDITPLLQMSWLDRLWVSGYENISEEEKQLLREALPDTQLCFQFGSSTTCGWRHSPNYYIIRDLQDMPYMLS